MRSYLVAPARKGGRGLKHAALTHSHDPPVVAPARKGGRGLKHLRIRRRDGGGAVAPARKGGRGLKPRFSLQQPRRPGW